MNNLIKLTYKISGQGSERRDATRQLIHNLYAVGALDVKWSDNGTDEAIWTVEAYFPGVSEFTFGGT